MSGGSNTPGLSRLAGVIEGIAKKNANAAVILDFGEIQSDHSLLCNMYGISIPKSDYLICRSLAYPDSETNETSQAAVDGSTHRHTVSVVRIKDRHVRAGDRVLVAWVGNDAVVVDIIISADELF